MKSAPFSTSMMYLAIYAATAIIGGVVATLISSAGLPLLWTVILAIFIAFLCGGVVRGIVGGLFASAAGVQGDAPTAGSFAMRAVVGLVASAIVGWVLTQMSGISSEFALGALGALLVVMAMSVVFTFVVGTRS